MDKAAIKGCADGDDGAAGEAGLLIFPGSEAIGNFLRANVVNAIEWRVLDDGLATRIRAAAKAGDAGLILVVDGGEVSRYSFPFTQEKLRGFLDLVEVIKFLDGDCPTHNDHQDADADGDPAVEHHVFRDVSKEHDVLHGSSASVGSIFSTTGGLRLAEENGALRDIGSTLLDGCELDPRLGAGDVGNDERVELAIEFFRVGVRYPVGETSEDAGRR